MITISSESISENEMIMIGVVEGHYVQTLPSVSTASEKITLTGEALTKHKEAIASTRDAATKKMIEEAEAMGADAIVCVRYSSAPGKDATCDKQKTTEVMAYGTAVRFR